jgi:hypothetical protein
MLTWLLDASFAWFSSSSSFEASIQIHTINDINVNASKNGKIFFIQTKKVFYYVVS